MYSPTLEFLTVFVLVILPQILTSFYPQEMRDLLSRLPGNWRFPSTFPSRLGVILPVTNSFFAAIIPHLVYKTVRLIRALRNMPEEVVVRSEAASSSSSNRVSLDNRTHVLYNGKYIVLHTQSVFERRLHMPFYFKPHTPEWFEALEAFDPIKATVTKIVVESLGSLNVCSVCGDHPAQDYELMDTSMQKNAVATIRLCDDCLKIKLHVHREKWSHFGQSKQKAN